MCSPSVHIPVDTRKFFKAQAIFYFWQVKTNFLVRP